MASGKKLAKSWLQWSSMGIFLYLICKRREVDGDRVPATSQLETPGTSTVGGGGGGSPTTVKVCEDDGGSAELDSDPLPPDDESLRSNVFGRSGVTLRMYCNQKPYKNQFHLKLFLILNNNFPSYINLVFFPLFEKTLIL
jgi:hypothetical protein